MRHFPLIMVTRASWPPTASLRIYMLQKVACRLGSDICRPIQHNACVAWPPQPYGLSHRPRIVSKSVNQLSTLENRPINSITHGMTRCTSHRFKVVSGESFSSGHPPHQSLGTAPKQGVSDRKSGHSSSIKPILLYQHIAYYPHQFLGNDLLQASV